MVRWARTDGRSTSRRVGRTLVAGAVLAVVTGLAAVPVGALSLPIPVPEPVTTTVPSLPRVPVVTRPAPQVRPVVLPAPKVTTPPVKPPLVTPPRLPAPTLPGLLAPVAPVVGSVLASRPGVLVPSLLAGATDAVAKVASPAAPRVLASANASVRAAGGMVSAVSRGSSITAGRDASADRLAAASGPTVRRLPRGEEVQIVPRSVCSSQVAAGQPASPALCVTVTPEEAAALGLSPEPDASPFARVGLLALTGVSIAALVLIGVMSLGLGSVVHPVQRSRARRRAALA
jgi:hypothetical protein